MLNFSKLFFFYILIIYNTYAYSDEQKIVYLNLNFIVENSTPGMQILQELEIKKKQNIKKFKIKENELLTKEKDLLNKKNILSQDEFESKALALSEEMKIYNTERKKIFLEFEKNKKKELNNFLGKITPLIENFVKENSINIVLNEKNLFIASKKFDITDQIIQIVNQNIK
tara:strand:- start:950 stop:1462 length:513 start_codon:yes stop_codon:yes gene_type:complete